MKFLWLSSSRVGAPLGVGMLLLAFLFPVTAAAASAIAQGFKAGGDGIVSGALVSLQQGVAGTVELSTAANSAHLVGVVERQSLIDFANGGTVQVVTSGTTPVLVSDINGLVKTGDRITASPIVGVGMKATESATVAGSAQADMQLSTAETRQVTAANGKQHTVHVGAVPLLVSAAYYQPKPTQSKFVPSGLQTFAANIAGHQVPPVRILVAGLVVVLLFVSVAVLLNSSVRSSIIAIGRNPLSGQSVRRSLFEVGVTTVGVLAFTVIAVYLILTA
ncbi:MAG TPA: hypothetical protein VLF71_02895 [Candidatus Saccharimonadales bacterium]|nr:hypothetical protein [Candidatus Saccharimonadales bacterium]